MVRGRKSQLSVKEIACHCTQELSVWCVYVCVAITNCTWIYPNVISNKCKRSTDEAILIIIDVHRYQYCILADQFKMRELFNWLDMRGGKTRTTRTPAFWDTAPWLPILVIHIRSQVKTRQSQSYKFKKIAKNPNFEILQETLHATHLLKLLDKMSKYEMDPTRTVGSTERTRNAGRTDGRMDGRTYWQMDRRTEWNQYTPQQLFCTEGMIIILQETHSTEGQKHYGKHIGLGWYLCLMGPVPVTQEDLASLFTNGPHSNCTDV